MTKTFTPSSDEFAVEKFPFYWIALTDSKYSLEMEKKLKTIGLDITRWRILMLLKQHGEMSISSICIHAVGKIPTITKIVYRMKSDNLVNIKTSESDARVSLVSIRDKGLEKIEHIISTTDDLFAAAFSGFTTSEIENLNLLTKKLLTNLFLFSDKEKIKKNQFISSL